MDDKQYLTRNIDITVGVSLQRDLTCTSVIVNNFPTYIRFAILSDVTEILWVSRIYKTDFCASCVESS